MRQGLLQTTLALTILAAAGCATMNHAPIAPAMAHSHWVVHPFANNTETPLAGLRAASITKAILQSRGVEDVRGSTEPNSGRAMLPGAQRPMSTPEMLHWSRQHNYRYALTGAVNEWRYKVGIDGEPAVGVTMELWDVNTGRVVWSGVGAKSGTSGQAVSYVGQRLIAEVTSSIKLG